MSRLSRRAGEVKPSPTLAIAARATELRKAGRDIVSLSVGEPDFPVFPHVADAVREALVRGATKYTATPGTPELRAAIGDWVHREIGLRYEPAEVLATAGAKQALYNACQVLLDPGDEAVIPNPYWVSYPEMVRLAGATPVELALEPSRGWVPRPEDLERVLTPRTRVLIFGSPSNPTGAIWSEEALRGIAQVLEKFPRVVVVSDDIYGRLVYGGAQARSLLQVAPQLRERTILVNGCSKSYAMTGLRLGWACGPRELIAAMTCVQDACTSNPSSLSQAAAVAALRGPQEPVEEMRRAFERRRDLACALLAEIPGIRCPPPPGAYYLFADVAPLLARRHGGAPLQTSLRLADVLLEEAGVATVPGSAFGREGFLRLSFATADAALRTALERLASAVRGLVP